MENSGIVDDLKAEVQALKNKLNEKDLIIWQMKGNERLYNAVTGATIAGISITDPFECFLYVNPAFTKMLEYSEAELIGKTIEDVSTPDEFRKFKNLTNSRQKGKISQYETTLVSKTGRLINVLVSASPLFNESAEFIGSLGVIFDITTRKNFQNIVFESEERYRTLFEYAPDVILLGETVSGKIIDVNLSASQMIKLPKDQIIGNDFSMIVPERMRNDAVDVFKNLTATLKTGEKITFPESVFLASDGTEIPVNILFQKIELNGSPVFQAVFRDISELKKIEQELLNHKNLLESLVEERTKELIQTNNELRKVIIQNELTGKALNVSENKYKFLLDTIPHGISEVDLDGNFIYANAPNHTILGYDQNELIGKSLLDILPGEEKEKFVRFLAAVSSKTISNKPFVTKNTRKDGKEVWVQVDWNYRFDENGNVNGYIAIITDITESKKSQEALKNSEEKYRKLADNLSDVIWSMDMKLNTNYISNSVSNFLGYTSEEYIEKPLLELLVPESWKLVEDTFNTEYTNLLKGNLDIASFSKILELEYIAKDGSHVWGEVNISLTTNDKGEVVGIHGVTRDATERKKYELMLTEAKEKAEQADRLKTTFLANMSHEIRTPMNGIIGFADLLTLSETTAQQRLEYNDYIKTSCNILIKLIDDIIDIAKIEAGELQIQKKDFNLIKFLNEAFELFKEERDRREKFNIEINLNIPENAEKTSVFTDSNRLLQVLINLANNALKFTEKGYIEVGCSFLNDDVLFFVKDTGIGFPENQKSFVFERFRQLDYAPDKRKYGGTGLGLAISKNIVELLGGEIWVETSEGEGSSFYFALPGIITGKELTEEPELTATEEIVTSEINWEDKVILIVEDDDLNFKFIQSALSTTKAKLLWATDGKDAVDTCKAIDNIDLVLMDLQLPILDGYEATKQIKKHNKELPVIAQTAVAMVDKRQKIFNAGCDDYLTKPILPEDLLKIIGKYL